MRKCIRCKVNIMDWRKSNMNNLLKTIKNFIVLIQKKNEHILAYILFGSLIEASILFLNLYFSSQIINLVIKKEYGLCKQYVLIFLILIALFERLNSKINIIFDKSHIFIIPRHKSFFNFWAYFVVIIIKVLFA